MFHDQSGDCPLDSLAIFYFYFQCFLPQIFFSHSLSPSFPTILSLSLPSSWVRCSLTSFAPLKMLLFSFLLFVENFLQMKNLSPSLFLLSFLSLSPSSTTICYLNMFFRSLSFFNKNICYQNEKSKCCFINQQQYQKKHIRLLTSENERECVKNGKNDREREKMYRMREREWDKK